MIESEIELLHKIEEIQNKIPETSLLLFRGQTTLYDKIRSGKARPNTIIFPEVENGWNTIVNRLTKKISETKFNQAILQHYGFPTYYIDLTKDPLTAAWFSCCKLETLKPIMWIGVTQRFQDQATYRKVDNGVGFIFVLEIPNYKEKIKNNKLFDLMHESAFLRPKKQSAFLMLDQPPRLPNPNDFVTEIIEIDRSKFESSKTLTELFPIPKYDKGYEELLNVPFVQLPSYYLSDKVNSPPKKEEDKISLDMDKYFVFGKRAIRIPLYVQEKNDIFEFNPKWKDFVLYEPSPFRLWKTETLDISDIHEGQQGRFGEAAKITISPTAFRKLLDYEGEIDLEWPAINSDSIFFTKAEIEHDKVSDHTPPYLGIWLHKNNNLILETHMVSNENEEIEIQLGHGYILENANLHYVQIDRECECGNPNDHIKLIETLLKMHGLNKKQEVALIQHPFMIENWFVLL